MLSGILLHAVLLHSTLFFIAIINVACKFHYCLFQFALINALPKTFFSSIRLNFQAFARVNEFTN